MIEIINRSFVAMNSRTDLFINVVFLLCIFLLDATKVESQTVTPTNGELQKEFDDVTLSCAVSGMATYTVDWKRDGKPLAGDKFVLSENKQSLTIKKANRIDVGQYECVFTPEPVGTGAGKVTGQAIVTSVPFVDAFHGSVSPLHGDEVIIDCKVYGEPAPEVSWTKDGTKLENSTKTEMDVLKIDEKNGRLTARLTIRNLEYEDRAKYGCLAITNSNNSTQEILVRVKDRYAALYPFIGICVEVIIIVIIIFIYEKRKTKSSDDDSDSGGKTNSHDQRGDVRQRNTVRT